MEWPHVRACAPVNRLLTTHDEVTRRLQCPVGQHERAQRVDFVAVGVERVEARDERWGEHTRAMGWGRGRHLAPLR
jgi:hypothetical protein